jgi:hypothetical protein
MSASGRKTEIYNPRERALSSDLNRMQAFQGMDLSSILAYLLDYQGDFSNSNGAGSVGAASTSPMRAAILNGLLVRPQMASANTLVDPGVAIVVDPDSTPSPDDSPYKLVNDPGVQTGSSLAMPTNSSGGTQIYVVECQRIDTVLEADNRDIYNPASQLFSPALVNKVAASRFGYRIRVGAIASGVTTVAGWVPLLVALVPNGAATWNAVPYMWDVRPLAADRAEVAGKFTRDRSRVDHHYRMVATPGLQGWAETVGPGGRILGGTMTTDAVSIATSLDFTSSELQPAGYAVTANRPYYLWLAEPFGLPRWCRYTSVASGSRQPGPLRGRPVPTHNQNTIAIPLPTAFGFPAGSAAGTAACVFGGMVNSAGAPILRGVSDGKTFNQESDEGSSGTSALVPTSSTSASTVYDLAGGTHYPANAKAILLHLTTTYSTNATSAALCGYNVTFDDGSGNVIGIAADGVVTSIVGQAYFTNQVVKIPIATPYPAVANSAVKITVNHGGGFAGYVVAPNGGNGSQVIGWDL